MKTLSLVFIFFLLFIAGTGRVSAFFPRDAVTKSVQLLGVSSYTFESGTSAKTVLGASVQQSVTSSNTEIRCGTKIIMMNYAKDTTFNAMQYPCFDTLSATKIGNDNSFIILTYVNRDVATQSAELGITVDLSKNTPLWGGLYSLASELFVIGFLVAVGVGWYVGNWLYKR